MCQKRYVNTSSHKYVAKIESQQREVLHICKLLSATPFPSSAPVSMEQSINNESIFSKERENKRSFTVSHLARYSFLSKLRSYETKKNWVFSVISLPAQYFPPVQAVAVATSAFTKYIFCESVDSAHISQILSTFQEADCLLKLVKVNKQVFAITFLNRNLDHTAQLSIN